MADTITHYLVARRFLDKNNFSKDFERSFLLGAQGPDFFFFGLTKESFDFGELVHEVNIKNLFETDSKDIESTNDLYKGYYFGIMLHYFVDRIIHQYVAYRMKKYPEAGCHSITETSIDMIFIKRELGIEIKDFPFKKYYKYSNDVIDMLYEFYNKRYESEFLIKKHFKKCIKNFIFFTDQFIKPRFYMVIFTKFLERKEENKGKYISHLKLKENIREDVMNDDKNSWEGIDQTFNLSVEEILDKALNDFINEYNLVLKKDNYEFNHKETFSANS